MMYLFSLFLLGNNVCFSCCSILFMFHARVDPLKWRLCLWMSGAGVWHLSLVVLPSGESLWLGHPVVRVCGVDSRETQTLPAPPGSNPMPCDWQVRYATWEWMPPSLLLGSLSTVASALQSHNRKCLQTHKGRGSPWLWSGGSSPSVWPAVPGLHRDFWQCGLVQVVWSSCSLSSEAKSAGLLPCFVCPDWMGLLPFEDFYFHCEHSQQVWLGGAFWAQSCSLILGSPKWGLYTPSHTSSASGYDLSQWKKSALSCVFPGW